MTNLEQWIVEQYKNAITTALLLRDAENLADVVGKYDAYLLSIKDV